MKQVPHEIIQKIADQVGSGFRVFLHTETLEVVTCPDEDKSLSFEPSMWKMEMDMVRKQRQNFFEVRGMEPHDSFRIMEDFIHTVNDKHLQERLSNALLQQKPFAHFKRLIDLSGTYRQQWFSFRNQRMLLWVQEQLEGIP